MHRCLELARLGAGHVAPNPMVGAVLVFEDRIIGEGYHRQYGKAHAEVNCIDSVSEADRDLISRSTIYVSLEPCAHHGKTPPCADLLIAKNIPRVVVGCRDPFPKVDGKGIEKLKAAGIEVTLGVLEKECIDLNRRFFTFHTRHRPYIVLKWAQSANGYIARPGERTPISNEYTNRLVHKWRSEEASILVGPRTALIDNPALTARGWTGPDPIRLVIDKDLQLPAGLQLFDRKVKTIVFNTLKHEEENNLLYYQVAEDSSLVNQLITALHRLKIDSVLVEGGARLLQSFIDEGVWDEARVITNNDLVIPAGLPAPRLQNANPISHESLLSDTIRYYHHD
ncbi:bifunctional diaminohydroxyphosphoribosylaminopyrimidine deaminase/5-amino-6-(5-phosphoribosylamino)uracil reductase RibD [Puia dinghuensis]|uniref:Riboflavin biosynthesis protein RibD n=1 Tax=Puia dinghuensis TaxID=1792502 RepID=A0A8J2UIB6_9BACT|nr:bifunctional diaminohydroxyphosphoribosylaminopyrimidine deaminase/5-amino-6-(5-phosphoribosylamino)uracil reductase RibD [Puia dinghuensis]GGB21678.1 riboflavin biosynthesis protein RibD [Puia dinghuensis]